MELADGDRFQLRVLLASEPLAIRLDESRLSVHGLRADGSESVLQLTPASGAPERYLRLVREFISGQVLGSPGGYPVYLRRWSRMGQMRPESLEQLLRLGEPEAVMAAISSPGLTEELAQRAWWALEDVEAARHMLAHPEIAASAMGPRLAAYLHEHLPFETDDERAMDAVRLILQPDLIHDEARMTLWRAAKRRPAWRLGFLQAGLDALPKSAPARIPAPPLAALAAEDNALAHQLVELYSSAGQSMLLTLSEVLERIPTQETLLALFVLLRERFAAARPEGDPDLALDALREEARLWAQPGNDALPDAVRVLLSRCPESQPELAAMRLLSGAGYGLMRPLIDDASISGSVLRRRLAPVMNALDAAIRQLRGV